MKRNILIVLIVIGLALTLNFFSVRTCPFYVTFRIPCPGCGLTRAVSLILKGQIASSLKYSILPIPLLFAIVTYVLFYFVNRDLLNKLVKKYEKAIIAFSVIIAIAVWIININNPLLY
ncbi:MAG: DUF2752 domain-containing protein [Clostridia bacterium]|nr:DUF2752 domain-containing protein [Clostridia bacterium]